MKEKLKHNRIIAFFYFGIKSILTVIKRKLNGVSKEYLALKDTHLGEKCFIVGTGPSLRLEDLEMIKGQYSFSMNSIFKLFDKTTWKPNCYAISDPNVYKSMRKDVDDTTIQTKLFAPEVNYKGENGIIFPTNNRNYYLSQCKGSKTMTIGLSKKMDMYINNGPSVVFCLIQIAIYMGFKQIYLLGIDCNYKATQTHSSLTKYEYARKISLNAGELMIKAYESIVDDLNEYGVNVFNCTRGGMLEVFPRLELEDAVSKN